jgi:cytochrome c oxidase cbb3-type subunit 4
MDLDTLRIAIMLTLFVSFIGVWIWAWSKKRKTAFEEASMLPLEDDDGHIPTENGENRS